MTRQIRAGPGRDPPLNGEAPGCRPAHPHNPNKPSPASLAAPQTERESVHEPATREEISEQPSARSAARRRRGIEPNDLRQRVDRATTDIHTRMVARFLAGQLGGLAPSALTDGELAELREAWEPAIADQALAVLEEVGYGAPAPRRSRSQRAHGLRRDERLKGVLGRLPRSLAARLPTTADTHRRGRNDGADIQGPVSCSLTLRPDHLGVVAAACGLWHQRAGDGEGFVDVTAGELVQLLTGRRRVGGKDVAWVHGLLADWEAVELDADVSDRPGKEGPVPYTVAGSGFVTRRSSEASGPSEAHRIPSSPIASVERRVGDQWVGAAQYSHAIAAAAADEDDADLLELHGAERSPCVGIATIRIHLARWVRAELAHATRRPVFINFDVWAYLRPQARRTYAFVQALGRDDYDGRLYFYLGAPVLYTLGLAGRRDRARSIVSDDLTALWHGDRRYHEGSGFRAQLHANTKIPAFACDAARMASSPTPVALSTKSLPKRPSSLRGAVARLRRHSIVSARGVTPDQMDPGHVRRVGLEAAKREAELVRQTVQRSLLDAGAGAGAGPFDPSKAAALRREQSRTDDDGDPAAA